MSDLNQQPGADLSGAGTVGELGRREGFADPVTYAAALHRTMVGWEIDAAALDAQRERLAALANIAERGALAKATAEELTSHYAILAALALRFSRHAAKADPDTEKRPDNAIAWATAALRCQKAAQRVLGALHVLADDALIKGAPRVGQG